MRITIKIKSVTFVGNTPHFTGIDATGRQRTFASPVHYSVQQAAKLLNQTITIY